MIPNCLSNEEKAIFERIQTIAQDCPNFPDVLFRVAPSYYLFYESTSGKVREIARGLPEEWIISDHVTGLYIDTYKTLKAIKADYKLV